MTSEKEFVQRFVVGTWSVHDAENICLRSIKITEMVTPLLYLNDYQGFANLAFIFDGGRQDHGIEVTLSVAFQEGPLNVAKRFAFFAILQGETSFSVRGFFTAIHDSIRMRWWYSLSSDDRVVMFKLFIGNIIFSAYKSSLSFIARPESCYWCEERENAQGPTCCERDHDCRLVECYWGCSGYELWIEQDKEGVDWWVLVVGWQKMMMCCRKEGRDDCVLFWWCFLSFLVSDAWHAREATVR